MYRASTGNRFIFVVTNDITNYLVTITLYREISYDIQKELINYVFLNMVPSYLIFDDDQAFLSSVM